jgi:undecaprenyl pyrophosphate synthase
MMFPMSPVSLTPTLQSLLTTILKLGPIPQHIGFIMDGNRRFAKDRGLHVSKGHLQGFHKLEEVSRNEWLELSRSE